MMSPRVVNANKIKFDRPKPISIPNEEFKQSLVTFRDIGKAIDQPELDISALRPTVQNDSLKMNNEERD